MIKRYIALYFILAAAAAVPAQEAAVPPNPAGSQGRSAIELNIRFFDKRIYYVADSPIFVQVSITNKGAGPYRFKLADERAWSVDFGVRTVSNRMVEPAAVLVRRRSASAQVFFREISVESGESFSFVEDLRDYADLNQSGAFVVQARVYPELYHTAALTPQNTFLESNRLSLNIRPPSIPGPDGIPLAMDVETNALLVREKLPPDEVVAYTLTARQKSQWEKFFLYLDLDAMVSRDGSRRRQWLAESEEGRRRMTARYRTELQNATVDGDIATIPSEFQIERTSYGAEEGSVVVLEKFRGGAYTERRRYTYTLRRRDDIWMIVDYTVVNLGTE
ncbi:MAG: hypothetical protein LBH70_04200 [Spirochaetaceae bacterium]|jgi:hypothetical protein|nr:hypothetical protein [Spirochaetaceae bacterium]